MKKLLLWVALTFLSITQMWAITANPELIRFHQPESEIFLNIYLKGDEKVHWAETEDGYTLLHADNGALMYAMVNENGNLVASSYLATDPKDRSEEVINFLANTKKHLHFSKAQVEEMLSLWNDFSKMKNGPKTMQNVIGEKRFLVVLFAFQDQEFTFRKAEFQQLFNQINYTTGGRTGSVHDYYYDVSSGQFSLNVDIVGPFTGIYDTEHYGDTDNGYQDFANEAVDSAARFVDFSNYDNDGDGYIDGLHIIFAGKGEEATGIASQIWSHKWNIFNEPEYNNTIINVYSCSPEMSGSTGENITAIGVICHELGHVFGAPDYYDTDYAGSGGEYPGLGKWDIMSSGSWNRNGITPAHHNPYTKIYIYKWATCDTLTDAQMVTLNSVDRSNTDFHRVNTATPGDFFLIENRQQNKWDRGIPGHGMIVYHIHPNASGSYVSNARHPQQIYILAKTAQGVQAPTSSPSSYGDLNSSTAPFPGEMRRDSLTDNSTPWFRPWNGQENHAPITNISENSELQTVSFCFKGAQPSASNFVATGVSHNKMRLDWANYGSYRVIIAQNESNTFGTPSGFLLKGDTIPGGGIVKYVGNANMAFIDSLNADQHYYYRIFTKLNDTTYSPNFLNADATTLSCEATDWSSEDFDNIPTGEAPTCWTGNWTVEEWATSQRSNFLMSPVSDAPAHAETAPIRFADSIHNVVLKLQVAFINAQENDSLNILFRPSPTSAWTIAKSIHPSTIDTPEGFVYVDLPEVTDFTLIGFDFYHNGNSRVAIDDLLFTPGYLIHAFSDAHGDIEPSGYLIQQMNDTVVFTFNRHPGYQFANVYINGTRSTTLVQQGEVPTLKHRVIKSADIKATFIKNEGIDRVQSAQLKAYPNPTTGRLIIERQNQHSDMLVLMDLYGRTIRQWKAEESTMELNLQDLNNGIYILRSSEGSLRIIVRK